MVVILTKTRYEQARRMHDTTLYTQRVSGTQWSVMANTAAMAKTVFGRDRREARALLYGEAG